MAAPQPDATERLFDQMSDDALTHDDPYGDDALAAEVALGVLTGAAQTQAEARMRDDPAFAILVHTWEERFAALTDEVAPVAPPRGTLRKIKRRAYGQTARSLWQQLGIIPAFVGAAAAALVLVVVMQFGLLDRQTGPTPTLVAELASEDESLLVAAAFVEGSGQLFVEWRVGDRLADRDVQLWLIAAEGAPVPLGVLNKGTPFSEFAVPDDLRDRLAAGATLAVSDEPLGGSPTGVPTGAVLAAGEITPL